MMREGPARLHVFLILDFTCFGVEACLQFSHLVFGNLHRYPVPSCLRLHQKQSGLSAVLCYLLSLLFSSLLSFSWKQRASKNRYDQAGLLICASRLTLLQPNLHGHGVLVSF